MVTTRSAGGRDNLDEPDETTRQNHGGYNPETQEADLAELRHPNTSPAPVSTGSIISTRIIHREDVATQPSGTEARMLRVDVPPDAADAKEELFIGIMHTLDIVQYEP
jgi:hypothetical protein